MLLSSQVHTWRAGGQLSVYATLAFVCLRYKRGEVEGNCQYKQRSLLSSQVQTWGAGGQECELPHATAVLQPA